ncbi:type IV pilus assembly protein PilP [Lampropedia hyalina DSM 16112]|uniref:Type IV pilus assembly protein PilP n=2 Tax=Lampropedia TaxID=198705 RepID=A0A1M4SQQ1_9BURK|nr:type IV pilus assembly protein PilP [Lampropedia hyalina DSM 16112]
MTRLWSTGLMAAALLLTGCISDPRSEVSAWMEEQKRQTPAKIPPLKEPLVFQPVAYNRDTATNPFGFQKLAQVFGTGIEARRGLPQWVIDAQNRRKEPLESYSLDAMQMVGYLQKAGKPTALILVDGHLYQVVPGNHLGYNMGRIVSIRETQLELKEVVQDATGDWLERSTVLELQQ